MLFNVTVRLGFSPIELTSPSSLVIDQHDIDLVGAFAGAYHILDMGRHFRDYVERSFTPAFPPIHGLPATHVEPLTNKQRAEGVTGNIGEAVAGIVAQRVLAVPTSGIAHIRLQRPFRKRACPDYMIRVGQRSQLALAYQQLEPQLYYGPDWWPLESKSRRSEYECNKAVASAFRQLVAYWYTIAPGPYSDYVGFGFVVTCAYDTNPGICLHVFEPWDAACLKRHLHSFPNHKALLDAIKADKQEALRGFIRG